MHGLSDCKGRLLLKNELDINVHVTVYVLLSQKKYIVSFQQRFQKCSGSSIRHFQIDTIKAFKKGGEGGVLENARLGLAEGQKREKKVEKKGRGDSNTVKYPDFVSLLC